MNRNVVQRVAVVFAALALAACSGSSGTDPLLTGNENPDATLFIAQNEPPAAVMEALYTGKVNRDEQGCLRVENEGGAMVIWPYGFKLSGRSDGLHVTDASGRSIGRIGGDFRMGGGFVPAGSFAPITDEDLARVQTRCPSTHYWVVGDTDLQS